MIGSVPHQHHERGVETAVAMAAGRCRTGGRACRERASRLMR